MEAVKDAVDGALRRVQGLHRAGLAARGDRAAAATVVLGASVLSFPPTGVTHAQSSASSRDVWTLRLTEVVARRGFS